MHSLQCCHRRMKPDAGCQHKVQRAKFHETFEADLEERRARQSEVDPIPGTRRLHHYRFLRREDRVNVMMVRWLSCTCIFCHSREWSSCVNKHMVGEWVEVRQSILDQRGVYAQLGVRKQLSDKLELADNLAWWCRSRGCVHQRQLTTLTCSG